jgi:hypothetical protein
MLQNIAQVLAEFRSETGFSSNAKLIWPGSSQYYIIGHELIVPLPIFSGEEAYVQITASYYWSSSEQNPLLIFEPWDPKDISIAVGHGPVPCAVDKMSYFLIAQINCYG